MPHYLFVQCVLRELTIHHPLAFVELPHALEVVQCESVSLNLLQSSCVPELHWWEVEECLCVVQWKYVLSVVILFVVGISFA